jgi:hypothetical protein
MAKNRAFSFAALVPALCLAGVAVIGACADKKGSILLAIDTDMKAPKDVNAVSVTISTNGAIKHSFIGRVTPQGEVLLPATLAIVEPDDKSASIRIRVMAFQDQKPRVLRDVRTTVPTSGRTALLRIPLNFVNDGSAVGPMLPSGLLPPPFPGTGTSTGTSGSAGGTSGSAGGTSGSAGGTSSGDVGGGTSAGDYDFFGSFQPPCPDIQNQTIIDGACADNFVDPAVLPDFDEGSLGNSTDQGSCFDVAKCFAGAAIVGNSGKDPNPIIDAGTGPDASRGDDASAPGDAGFDGGAKFKDFVPSTVTLDATACALQLNGANPARLNIALVTPDTGECIRPGECYIPVDHGGAGWKEDNGRVQLPGFVCKLLTGKNLRLATSSEICAAKGESNPLCTPMTGASSVSSGGPMGNPLNPCGAPAGCSPDQVAPYNMCIQHQCSTGFTQCFGPNWSTGNYSGPCASFLGCITKCGCGNQACFQACGQPSAECQTCTQALGNCAQSCDPPACAGRDAGSSGTSGSSGASSGSSGTSGSTGMECSQLAACCAAIADQNMRMSCQMTLSQTMGDPTQCAAAFMGYKAYCGM